VSEGVQEITDGIALAWVSRRYAAGTLKFQRKSILILLKKY
jgi:hypothetical protein